MSLADHVAIILSSALDAPRAGKANPNKPDFYVQAAFPPAATELILAEMTAATPNGSLRGMKHSVAPNGSIEKPFPGIPDDWVIVRLGTGPGYPPDLYGEDGKKISVLPVNAAQINREFYTGQRVRLNGFARYWTHDVGGKGVSWSLNGVMAEGGGERRGGGAGEPSEDVFSKYREVSGTQSSGEAAPAAAGKAEGNPFQQSGTESNPFGGKPKSSNPFAG